MKKQQPSWKPDSLYFCGLALLAAALFLLAVSKLTGISPKKVLLPCLFHTVTSLYCPGCGGTRAVEALLQGRILESLHYHPVVLYGAVLYSWYMISNTLQYVSRGRVKLAMQYRTWYVWAGIAILVLQTLWKNAMLLLYGRSL